MTDSLSQKIALKLLSQKNSSQFHFLELENTKSVFRAFLFYPLGSLEKDVTLDRINSNVKQLEHAATIMYERLEKEKEDFSNGFAQGPLIRVIQWGSKQITMGFEIGYFKKKPLLLPKKTR